MSGFPSPRGPCTAAEGSRAGGALTLPCLGAFYSTQGKGKVEGNTCKLGVVLKVRILRRAWELGLFSSEKLCASSAGLRPSQNRLKVPLCC